MTSKPVAEFDNGRELKRRDILRGRSAIRSCLASKPLYTKYLIMHYLQSPERKAAFFVPKRTGNAAQRNLAKRRMREIYRNSRESIPTGSIIFRLRENIGWDELRDEFSRAVEKIVRSCV